MLTRKKIRGTLSWVGIGVGIAGVLLYLLSWFTTLTYQGPLRELEIGRGVIHLAWHQQERTIVRAVPGAAPIANLPANLPPPALGDVRRLPMGTVIYTESGYIPATRVTRPRQVQFQAAGAWRWRPQFRTPGGTEANNWYGNLIIPAWMLVLLGAWCAYRRLPWDVTPGRCPGCMFDLDRSPPLKENPALVRCPECGRVSRHHPPAKDEQPRG